MAERGRRSGRLDPLLVEDAADLAPPGSEAGFGLAGDDRIFDAAGHGFEPILAPLLSRGALIAGRSELPFALRGGGGPGEGLGWQMGDISMNSDLQKGFGA